METGIQHFIKWFPLYFLADFVTRSREKHENTHFYQYLPNEWSKLSL